MLSARGKYGLKALIHLGEHQGMGGISGAAIAEAQQIPKKFLDTILLELKNARIVESVRGAKGGYQLRRPPSEILLSDVVRLVDGPLAPFGDAEQLRNLIDRDNGHRALYQVFLDVRNAAAKILENTTLADIVSGPESAAKSKKRQAKRKEEQARVLPMTAHGSANKGPA